MLFSTAHGNHPIRSARTNQFASRLSYVFYVPYVYTWCESEVRISHFDINAIEKKVYKTAYGNPIVLDKNVSMNKQEKNKQI